MTDMKLPIENPKLKSTFEIFHHFRRRKLTAFERFNINTDLGYCVFYLNDKPIVDVGADGELYKRNYPIKERDDGSVVVSIPHKGDVVDYTFKRNKEVRFPNGGYFHPYPSQIEIKDKKLGRTKEIIKYSNEFHPSDKIMWMTEEYNENGVISLRETIRPDGKIIEKYNEDGVISLRRSIGLDREIRFERGISDDGISKYSNEFYPDGKTIKMAEVYNANDVVSLRKTIRPDGSIELKELFHDNGNIKSRERYSKGGVISWRDTMGVDGKIELREEFDSKGRLKSAIKLNKKGVEVDKEYYYPDGTISRKVKADWDGNITNKRTYYETGELKTDYRATTKDGREADYRATNRDSVGGDVFNRGAFYIETTFDKSGKIEGQRRFNLNGDVIPQNNDKEAQIIHDYLNGLSGKSPCFKEILVRRGIK